MLKFFARPADNVFVGGPMQLPTPSLPVRPEPFGVGMNALMSFQRFGVGLERLQSPIWSGLTVADRATSLRLAALNARLLKYAVMLAKIKEIGIREYRWMRCAPCVAGLNRNQTVRLRIRKRTKDHRIHDAEDSRVYANP